MTFSPILALYRGASAVAGVFAGAALSTRVRNGKEDPARLDERFARYVLPRPPGRMMWLHAASVGESGVAFALIEALGEEDRTLSFLLSTGTRTSAELAARRAPVRTTHVYAPLDRPDIARRFMRHWRPDAAVFVESEIWPNLILEANRTGTPLALVNARMSPTTLRRWRRWRAAGSRLMTAFAWVSAADARTAETLSLLRGAPVAAMGNLKLAAPPPRVEGEARAALAAQIGVRPIWVAASTHEGEDAIVLAAHETVRARVADALLIIAPRHPERGEAVSALAGGAPRRSRFDAIGAAPVYVADTLGELGLLYDLAPVALVAGSMLPHLKGHNPIEPAKLGSAIISGPYVESFEDLFRTLFDTGGAAQARDAQSLAALVIKLMGDSDARERQLEAARAVTNAGMEAFETTIEHLLALAPPHARQENAANASA